MKKELIHLGTHKKWGTTYLTKHSWDCEWYWGFGYVGNSNCHWHIDSIIDHRLDQYEPNWTDIKFHFDSTWLTQKQWWILRDLFIIAYSFKKTAECYKYGGHNAYKEHVSQYWVINPEMVNKINADLKTILDNIWSLLLKWKSEQ